MSSDHPITVTRAKDRVVVSWNGAVIADSRDALDLKEASYPVVKYIPRADVDMTRLERTTHASHCPYKGDASYFSIRVGDAVSKDAAWSYEHPFEGVAAIAGHIAFYPDRVDAIEER
jgi:uncharacterized protein (DUF427 family)